MEDLHELNRRFVTATNSADSAYYNWAKYSNVTWHTLDLLYALDDGQPHSQKQICELWGIPKTTVNTVVKACREAGYVTLQPMPGHPRQQQICLTESGRAYAREALEDLYKIENQVMSETIARFGPEFVDAIEFWSGRFRDALEKNISEKEENSSL